jgi:hypothetical protein
MTGMIANSAWNGRPLNWAATEANLLFLGQRYLRLCWTLAGYHLSILANLDSCGYQPAANSQSACPGYGH